MATVIRGDDNFDTATPITSGSIALIADQIPDVGGGGGGGTFTSGAQRVRNLNTIASDSDNIVSLANNQFTLQAGTYTIRWAAPAHRVNRHQSNLHNVTSNALVMVGTSSLTAQTNNDSTTESRGTAVVTLSSSAAFEIRHECQTTYADYGFGIGGGNSTGNIAEVFTTVEIIKHH